jgi:hypothetical protein
MCQKEKKNIFNQAPQCRGLKEILYIEAGEKVREWVPGN